MIGFVTPIPEKCSLLRLFQKPPKSITNFHGSTPALPLFIAILPLFTSTLTKMKAMFLLRIGTMTPAVAIFLPRYINIDSPDRTNDSPEVKFDSLHSKFAPPHRNVSIKRLIVEYQKGILEIRKVERESGSLDNELLQQKLQLSPRKAQCAGAFDDVFRELGLALLELEDFFFDAVFGDEFQGDHIFVLPDAVRPRDGLLLGERIPPGIEDEHVIGGGEVQTRAPGFDGDEEGLYLSVFLEFFDFRLALFLGQIAHQPGKGLFFVFKIRPEEIEVFYKRTEDERFVPAAANYVPLFQHFGELAAGFVEIGMHQLGMVHQLAELGQSLQHDDLKLRIFALKIIQQQIPGSGFFLFV